MKQPSRNAASAKGEAAVSARAPAALSLLAMLPKSDKPQEKNQDSANYNASAGRFAVSDGATRTLFSELFSSNLTQHFCDRDDPVSRDLFASRDWRAWLEPCCLAWRESVPAQIGAARGMVQISLTNRWNAGDLGGATFAGIEFQAGHSREPIRWQAMVIGDCCLIHLDAKGTWLASHVIQSSGEFDSRPDMFKSGVEDDLQEPKFIQGTAAQGEFFILASDTMAKWLLQQHELGNWSIAYSWLMRLNDAQTFSEHINELRSVAPSVMDDDDLTLMLVQVGVAKPIKSRILIPASASPTSLQGVELQNALLPYHSVENDPNGSDWRHRVSAKVRVGWMTMRPHLTRQRILPAVAITLVMVAGLLAILAVKNGNCPPGDSTPAACVSSQPATSTVIATQSVSTMSPLFTTTVMQAVQTDIPRDDPITRTSTSAIIVSPYATVTATSTPTATLTPLPSPTLTPTPEIEPVSTSDPQFT
jgi:hypothetical protein